MYEKANSKNNVSNICERFSVLDDLFGILAFGKSLDRLAHDNE
jgi:hypothetical protein